MTNIILCGGSGTRLWPISRTLLPKQFIKLFNQKSLFQLTVQRNKNLCRQIYIVSNAQQYFLALDELEELNFDKKEKYLLEPIGRNTAPAIALACFDLPDDEIVFVTPSDHLINNQSAYKQVLKKANKFAKQNNLVTFGITPTSAETGYGYIEVDGSNVKAFYEKPKKNLAKQYLKQGNYYWNSGMFCFKAEVFLEELKNYAPQIYNTCQKAYDNAKKGKVLRISHEDMTAIPANSIDYAVMEKSHKVKVVSADIEWSDLGSFDALYQALPQDENANTKVDKLINIGSRNNLIVGCGRKIATVDLENLLIVDTPDALLISQKGSSQKVRQVVKKLTETSSKELQNSHITTHRPWGTYTILEEQEGYKIKRIVVKPNKRLSLQSHKYRNEHWVVISGTATVTVNKKTTQLEANQSTYIKAGDLHRLANQTDQKVVIIEVQIGSYTGEDDIIRYEDDFWRN